MDSNHLLICNRQGCFPDQRALGLAAHTFPGGSGEAPGWGASRMSYVLGMVSGREGRS